MNIEQLEAELESVKQRMARIESDPAQTERLRELEIRCLSLESKLDEAYEGRNDPYNRLH